MRKQYFAENLPPMLTGKELESALTVLPEYDASIQNQPSSIRLMALSDLYDLYLPSCMSTEIYSKLYLALIRSLQKKETQIAVRQQNENYLAIRQQPYAGIIGGSDSFTIIGTSGIGKSTAIRRSISLISGNKIIEVQEPFLKIVPCLVVQCPFDCSVKGLLLDILRKVDEHIDTRHYDNALRARATTDMLIGCVSQVALNHIGLLIVDEIQNVVGAKHGKSLVAVLTQLINNSGISICMVGTPESARFFEQAMQLARRSLGIQYGKLEYDAYFADFCKVLFRYQYVKNPATLTDGIVLWLYEHSSGIISNVVSLVHDAQEIAILSGKEALDLETLNEAYHNRLSLLHGFIEPSITATPKATTAKAATAIKLQESMTVDHPNLISELAALTRQNQTDIVAMLKEHMTIVEVAL